MYAGFRILKPGICIRYSNFVIKLPQNQVLFVAVFDITVVVTTSFSINSLIFFHFQPS